MQKIIPCLWFDGQAEEAANFYTSLFPDSKVGPITRYGKEGYEAHRQQEGTVMTVDFDLAGFQMLGLNGGPLFKFTPAISLSVVCESEAELDALWKELVNGGRALMELGKYEWAAKYGWVADRYGLSWQLSLGRIADAGQRITPCFLFSNEQYGRAVEAIRHYVAVFKNARTGNLFHRPDDGGKTLLYGDFYLNNERFAAMDGPSEQSFSEAFSLIVNCDSQEEIDHFWDKLTEGGEESYCGWLKDRFGVAWQVNPSILNEMLLDPDREKVARVTNAFMQMRKMDIQQLEAAYRG
ncbi:MAG: VOC family protein [Solitalea sp.]